MSIKHSLLLYCFKADNFDEFMRREILLIRYIQEQINKRFLQTLIKDLQNNWKDVRGVK